MHGRADGWMAGQIEAWLKNKQKKKKKKKKKKKMKTKKTKKKKKIKKKKMKKKNNKLKKKKKKKTKKKKNKKTKKKKKKTKKKLMNFRLGKTGQISGEYSKTFSTNPVTSLCHNCHIMPPLQQSNFRRTVGRNNQESRLKYWATRSSVRSHRSLVCLLRTACFTRALHCAHSLARLLTSLTPLLVGK